MEFFLLLERFQPILDIKRFCDFGKLMATLVSSYEPPNPPCWREGRQDYMLGCPHTQMKSTACMKFKLGTMVGPYKSWKIIYFEGKRKVKVMFVII